MPDRRKALIALTAGTVVGTLSTFPLWNIGADDYSAPVILPEDKSVDQLQVTYQFQNVEHPARTRVLDRNGTLVAVLTHGARTVIVTGRERTFTEPAATPASVVTTSWVYPAADPFSPDQIYDEMFASWLLARIGTDLDDVLGCASEYVTGSPAVDRGGVRIAGDAGFGQVHDDDAGDGGDFYDYLGIPWTWPDGTVSRPAKRWDRRLDGPGYVRIVYGYRMGMKLYRTHRRTYDGLPRNAFALAERAPCVTVAEPDEPGQAPADLSQVGPGDLCFFAEHEDEPTLITHVGIVLGRDTAGKTRFACSRQAAAGPTFGDIGGTAVLEDGYFGTRLRKVTRL